MSDLERLTQERELLDEKIKKAAERELAESLRTSCRRLAEDDSLPITLILGLALQVEYRELRQLAVRLKSGIDFHSEP